jgi:hypothetical protein
VSCAGKERGQCWSRLCGYGFNGMSLSAYFSSPSPITTFTSPHRISAIVQRQSAGCVPLVRLEPDEAFPLQVPLKFISIEVLQPERGEETLQVRHLVLSPTFESKGPPIRKGAFRPSDVERIVLGGFLENWDGDSTDLASDMRSPPGAPRRVARPYVLVHDDYLRLAFVTSYRMIEPQGRTDLLPRMAALDMYGSTSL